MHIPAVVGFSDAIVGSSMRIGLRDALASRSSHAVIRSAVPWEALPTRWLIDHALEGVFMR